MSMLPAFVLTLTLLVAFVMIPRIYLDWLHFRAYLQEGELEKLLELQGQENGWVIRHFSCALIGVALVIFVRLYPGLNPPEHLDSVTASYSVVSFVLALVESLFAQKIAQLTAVEGEPVGEQQEK